jgi:hypothetical protein
MERAYALIFVSSAFDLIYFANLVKFVEIFIMAKKKSVSLSVGRGEKSKSGGLTKKGVDKYNRETGSNLKMAVTTPPSKLKAGSKDANRRKSFCARSAGQMDKFPEAAKDPNSRLRLARKKWNC